MKGSERESWTVWEVIAVEFLPKFVAALVIVPREVALVVSVAFRVSTTVGPPEAGSDPTDEVMVVRPEAVNGVDVKVPVAETVAEVMISADGPERGVLVPEL
jgi:hypothetical protein